MITKVIAGIVLWLFISLVLMAFMDNSGCSFFDAFVAANALLFVAVILVVLIDFVLPWAFTTLFGGSA